MQQVLRTGERLGAKAIVVDSYAVTPAYLRQLSKNGYFVVYLDDFARPKSAAHLIVSGNIGAERLRFRHSPDAVVLAGNRFALIRREIRALRKRYGRPPIRARASRVLVCLGGSDPLDFSSRVLPWLDAVPGKFSVDVLVTRLFRHAERLRQVAESMGRTVRVRCEPRNVGQLMRGSDLAVTAAGVTSYELACLGVPFLVFKLYPNQRNTHKYLVQSGVALNAGRLGQHGMSFFVNQFSCLMSSCSLRRQLQHRAFRAFDGRGPERVVSAVVRDIQVKTLSTPNGSNH